MRILIVDKLHLFCQSLKLALQSENDMTVVGCAGTGEDAIDQLGHTDIVLLNVTFEEGEIIQLLRALTTRSPEIKILISGVSDDPKTILKYVEAGAIGYVLKNDSVETLVQKIRAAAEEEVVVSARMAAELIVRLSKLKELRSELWFSPEGQLRRFSELTPRELEVLELLGTGQSNQEIADRLYIEHGKVKNYVHRILQKLNASNRHEAAAAYMMRLKQESVANGYAAQA